MKPLLCVGALLSVLALPTFADMKEGDVAPQFTAPAALAGKELSYSLKAALAQGPVVVYFYPSAYTKGCNMQAHTFSVNMDKFTAAGASVVGVSLDSVDRLKLFSADPEYCAGKLPVASDSEGRIAESYQLQVSAAKPGFTDTRGNEVSHGFVQRTSFVVKTDGTIAASIGGVSPKKNVDMALAAVRELVGK